MEPSGQAAAENIRQGGAPDPVERDRRRDKSAAAAGNLEKFYEENMHFVNVANDDNGNKLYWLLRQGDSSAAHLNGLFVLGFWCTVSD